MTGIWNVWSVLERLLSVYFLNAWPFMLVHVALAVWTLGLWREIAKETEALKKWKPGGPEPTDCTKALNGFVRETATWGPLGVLVPMTDFSDRLDSRITGMIDSFHTRVNLFLIIGIAGTFYAMFEFAQDASFSFQLLAGHEAEIARAISQKLAYGLARAFPVGFFGLVLAMIGHLFAFRADKRLRDAVGDAVQLATNARSGAAQGLTASIVEALSPLRNLEVTLRESLQPVIAGFENQLRDTSELVRTQIQPLEGAISGFTAAVENLGPTASSLRAAANALAPALQRVTEIQLESHHQLERMHQMIDATGVALEAASNKMNDAAGALERLPERLEGRLAQELVAMSDGVKDLFRPVAESLSGSARSLSESAAELDCVPARLTATFQTELAGMTENALKAWDKTTQEFTRTVSDSALGYISAIAKAAADATGELVSAAHDMREVSLAAKATLEGALTRFLESGKEMLRPVVRDIDEAVQRRMPAVLASLRTAVESAKDLETSAEQVKNTITALTGTLDGANSSWRALIVQVESAIAKLDRTLPPPAPVLVPSCPNGQADDIKQIRADVGRISAKLDRRRRWWLFPCARTGANV